MAWGITVAGVDQVRFAELPDRGPGPGVQVEPDEALAGGECRPRCGVAVEGVHGRDRHVRVLGQHFDELRRLMEGVVGARRLQRHRLQPVRDQDRGPGPQGRAVVVHEHVQQLVLIERVELITSTIRLPLPSGRRDRGYGCEG